MQRLSWARQGFTGPLRLLDGDTQVAALHLRSMGASRLVTPAGEFLLGVKGALKPVIHVRDAAGKEVATARILLESCEVDGLGERYTWSRPSWWRSELQLSAPSGPVARIDAQGVEVQREVPHLHVLLALGRVWDNHAQGTAAATTATMTA